MVHIGPVNFDTKTATYIIANVLFIPKAGLLSGASSCTEHQPFQQACHPLLRRQL